MLASGVGRHRDREQVAQTVEVSMGAEVNLDPIAARWLAMNGWITTVAWLSFHPAGAGDPQVYDSGRFQVSDLATPDEQRRLVTES